LIERAFWETLDDPVRAGPFGFNWRPDRPPLLTPPRFKQGETEADKVWGAAYHIVPAQALAVQGYLDVREVNGYSVHHTPFHPADSTLPDIQCRVYIGTPDNPQFLGAQDPAAVAARINECRGPSGENREYLLRLDEALKSLSQPGESADDEHVSLLARLVRDMPVGGDGGGGGGGDSGKEDERRGRMRSSN